MRRSTTLFGIVFILTGLLGVVAGMGLAGSNKRPDQGDIALPTPVKSGGMSLTEALSKRRSIREFQNKPLSKAQISQLCWAAQGITEPTKGLRTAPSAMEMYPLALYLVDAGGLFEYQPNTHTLHRLRAGDAPVALRTANTAKAVATAPCCFIMTIDASVMQPRAGDKAERYCLLEAGHATQNLLLQATVLGLASVPIGGADESKVVTALNLPAGKRPVYLLPVGYPVESVDIK